MAARRLLVTGATGFVGTWVLRHWRETHPDTELWATSDRLSPPRVPVDRYRQLELRDAAAVRDYARECLPDQVIHLGGLTGQASLADHLSINVLGTENLYESLADAAASPAPRIVQVSSAAIYGLVRPDELPVTEDQVPRPVTAYGISKLAQDHVAVAMGYHRRLSIVRACVFNILGPGQPDSLVPMAFVSQLLEAKAGRKDRLKVGNLAPRRDFLDVRDVASAIDLLLHQGEPGQAYNVGSGADVSVGEIVERLMRISGLEVPVEADCGRARAVDVPCVRASITKLTAATAWRPSKALDDSLWDMWQETLSRNRT